MKNLLVVGDSQSAGYTETGSVKCYASYLAEKLNLRLINLSRPAVDNRYIKNTMVNWLSKNSAELILFHLAPFTRKCFYFDSTTRADITKCHSYPSFGDSLTANSGWYRSKGRSSLFNGHCPGDGVHTETFESHFDYYFHNYFHTVDSYLETLEILHHVQCYSQNKNLNLYFVVNNKYLFLDRHQEAQMYIEDLDLSKFIFYNDRNGFDEFVVENGYQASKNDYHANAHGHEHFSTLIMPVLFPANK